MAPRAPFPARVVLWVERCSAPKPPLYWKTAQQPGRTMRRRPGRPVAAGPTPVTSL